MNATKSSITWRASRKAVSMSGRSNSSSTTTMVLSRSINAFCLTSMSAFSRQSRTKFW